MSGKTAILAVRIIGDASGASKAADEASQKFGKFGTVMQKAAKPALVVAGALALLGKQALSAADKQNAAARGVQVVFGPAANAVMAYAQKAADATGLSIRAYDELAAGVGQKLNSMGVPTEKLAGVTDQLIKKSADLAAVFGGTTEEAVAALSGGITGQTKAMKKYGIVISQADVKARLAAQGQDRLTGGALKNAQAMATLALINEQSANTIGAFADEAKKGGTAAQVTAAKLENAKAALGQKLVPAFVKGQQVMAGFFNLMSSHIGATQAVVGVIGALAVAILIANGAMKAYRGIQTVITVATKTWAAVQAVMNAVMGAFPVILIVAGILALIAAVVLAYNKFTWFRQLVDAVWQGIQTGVRAVVAVVMTAWNGCWAVVSAAVQAASAVVSSVINGVQTVVQVAVSWVRAAWSAAWAAVSAYTRAWGAVISSVIGTARAVISAVVSWVRSAWTGAWSAASAAGRAFGSAISAAISAVRRPIDSLISLVRGALSTAWDKVRGPAQAVANGISSAWGAVEGVINRIVGLAQAAFDKVKNLAHKVSFGLLSTPARTADLTRTLSPGWTLYASGDPLRFLDRYTPLATARLTGRTTVSQTVNVTFTGLVTDPDATARQIERLLARRSVRTGMAA